MLRRIIVCLLIIPALMGRAQDAHDERLLERYSVEELNTMQSENPEEYAILDHALEVGISIGDIQEGKEIVFDGVLDKDPNQAHTYISLGLELIDNKYQYYRFKDSNKMVIVRPKDRITQIK